MRKLFFFFLLNKLFLNFKRIINNKWSVSFSSLSTFFLHRKKKLFKKKKVNSKIVNIWLIKMKYLRTYLKTIFYKTTRLKRKLKRIYHTNHYFLKFVFLVKVLIWFYKIINYFIKTVSKNYIYNYNINKFSTNINNKNIIFFINKKIGLRYLFGYRLIKHHIKFNNWTLLKNKCISTKSFGTKYIIRYMNTRLYNSFLKSNGSRKKKLKFIIKFLNKKKVLLHSWTINTKITISKKINLNNMKLNTNNNIQHVNFISKHNRVNYSKHNRVYFNKNNNIVYKYNNVNKYIYIRLKKSKRFYSTFKSTLFKYNAKYNNSTKNNKNSANTHNTKINNTHNNNNNNNKNNNNNNNNNNKNKNTSNNNKKNDSTNNNITKKNTKNNTRNKKKKRFFSRNISSHEIFLRKPLRRKKRKYLQRIFRLQQNEKLQSLLNSYKNIRNKTKFVRKKYKFNKNTLADFKKILKKKLKIRRKKKKKKIF